MLLWSSVLALPVAACGQAGQLQEVLRAVRTEAGAPGALLGLSFPDGETLTLASGVADLESGRPMRPDDAFFLGSVSKIYTAAAVLKLAEQGRIDLDDDLARYIGEVPRAAEVTVRDLLAHTSGLKDFYGYLYFRPDRAEMIRLVTRDWTHEEVLELVARLGYWSDPGSEWSYSSTNYYLLGLLVERVTGDPFAEALRALVLEPLELGTTWLTQHEPARAPLPGTGYMGPIDGWPHSDMFGELGSTAALDRSPIEWGAGGMAASSEDALSFLSALLGGRLLPRAALGEMTDFVETPQLGTPDSDARAPSRSDGYGLGLVRLERPEFTLVGHGGVFTGHTAGLWHVDRCGVTISLYFNRGFVNQRRALDLVLEQVAALRPEAAGCRNAEQSRGDPIGAHDR